LIFDEDTLLLEVSVKAFVLEGLLDGSSARLFIGTRFFRLFIVVVGIHSAEIGGG
jgi:hypothetical protein